MWQGQDDNPFADKSVTQSAYAPPSMAAQARAPLLPAEEVPSWASSNTLLTTPAVLAPQPSAADWDAIPEPASRPAAPSIPPLFPPSQPLQGAMTPHMTPQPQGDFTTQTTDKPSDALPKLVLTMRLYNMALSSFMIFAGFLSILGDDLASGVLVRASELSTLTNEHRCELCTPVYSLSLRSQACYLMAFSTLLCCFETHLKAVSTMITDNFGFMYSAKGRAAFLVFVAMLCFSQGLLGKICGCLMLFNAGFTFYVIFKHPEYEEIHRKYGTEDAGSVAARHGYEYATKNPQQVQKAAAAGASWAAENPQVVANAYAQQPPPQQQEPPQQQQQQEPQFSFV